MVQIHPKRAFLNTDVVISNKGDETVVVEDSLSHVSFKLSPGEYRSFKYPAGEHKMTIKSPSGIQEETFIVEDALKFGGSERKCNYIFDGNPWAIIVMRDRTYFFNEETKEQFVEHNLSPDKIEELCSDFLLFITGGDCSLFSLRTMSFEKTVSSSDFVYSGKNHCILAFEGGLHIWCLNSGAAADSFITVKCDDYIIDSEEEVILVYSRDEKLKIKVIKLLSNEGSREYESFSTVDFDGEFVGFPGCHTLLFTKTDKEDGSPNELYCKNLSSVGSANLLYKGEVHISTINGRDIWESNTFDDVWNKRKEIESGEGCKLSFDVVEDTGKVFHIMTVNTITVKDKKAEMTIKSSFYSDDNLVWTSVGERLFFSNKGVYHYLIGPKSTFLINRGVIKRVSGELLFSDTGELYVKNEVAGNLVYQTISGARIKCNPQKSRPSNGFFFQKDDNKETNKETLYWLKTDKWYVGRDVSKTHGVIVVTGGLDSIPPRLFLNDGRVIPVFQSMDDAIAVSATGTSILYEKGGYYNIARWKKKGWECSEEMVLSIYDNLKVKDAVFCSDGDSFIYQKEKEMVLFDFETGKETVFPSDTGIKFNVNGYRPYCVKDFFSRPKMVDPLTRRVIDNNLLEQYRFSNATGTVYFERRVVKKFQGDSEISDNEYMMLCEAYNFSFTTDTKKREAIKQNRIRYCKEKLHRDLNNHPLFPSIELSWDNFVDLFVVSKVEYAIINKDGRSIEVKVGSPLYFLNYVAFSPDSTRVAISGKYKDSSGVCVIYDLVNKKELHRSTLREVDGGVGQTKAIWLGLFCKKGDVAYYDSTPNTYYIHNNDNPIKIDGYSFLTFSPSGRYMALSRQGYTPYESDELFWGHWPSCDIYIADTENPQEPLCHFHDHGAGIKGTCAMRETIASASFSADDKKILSVSQDGVVVVRNLHLDNDFMSANEY